MSPRKRDAPESLGRCLHDQWRAERGIWPGGPGYMDYARFIARHPNVFGREGVPSGGAWQMVVEARALVILADGAPPSRWVPNGKTSPSGKTILECGGCGAESPIPTQCRGRCSDAEVAWGWSG